MKKSLFIILFSLLTIFMVTGCGEESSNGNVNNEGNTGGNGHTGNGGDSGNGGNSGNDGNSGSSEIMLNTIYGGIWKPGGITTTTYVALKIKDNEIVADYCEEQKAIYNVKNETGTYRKYSYKKEGNTYITTGLTHGTNDTLKLGKLYMEKGQLVLIGQDGREYARLDLVSSASDEEEIKYIIDEINKYRTANGSEPLLNYNDIGGCLKAVADIRAKEIEQLFEHKRPDGRPLETVLTDINYCKFASPSAHGENIAIQSSAQKAMEEWKASDGHNKNMLDKKYTGMAVGKNGKYYVVFFGRY